MEEGQTMQYAKEGQTIIYKTIYTKLKIEQHEPHWKNIFCFFLHPVSCVLNVTSVSGLSFLDFPFGISKRLFKINFKHHIKQNSPQRACFNHDSLMQYYSFWLPLWYLQNVLAQFSRDNNVDIKVSAYDAFLE